MFNSRLRYQEREKYGIEGPRAYRYVSRDKEEDTDANMDDIEDFARTRECIDVLGINESEKVYWLIILF